MRIFAACASLALIAHPSAAKPLQPAGKWRVDFGESHCIAQRIHGPPDKPIYLMLKASAVGEGLQLSIIANGRNESGVQEKAKLSFDGGAPAELWQLRYGAEKKLVRTVNLTQSQADQLARAASLRWLAPNIDYSIPLGPMTDLVELIEKCRTNLAEYWNGTEQKEALIKQGPRLDQPVRRLFSSSDYPDQAVMRRLSGTAKVVGLIDETGKMADCMVVETSGVAVLDAQTCIMIHKRGKFTPAIGADDKPAKSVFVQRVRWEMP